MDIVKNLSLEDAATRMGLSKREIERLAQRGEIVRFKKDGDYVYRIKLGQTQPVEPSPTPKPEPVSISSPQLDNGFIVLRDAHQSATALARKLEQDNSQLKEQLEGTLQQNRIRLFRWKMASVACIMTVLLLGSLLQIGWSLYQDRGRDILDAQHSLAVTTDHLEFKIDTARQQSHALENELTNSKMQQLIAQQQIDTGLKNLDGANARIEQLSRAVLEMFHSQNDRSGLSFMPGKND